MAPFKKDVMRAHKLLYMAGKGLEKASNESILKPHGLTMPRVIILHHLAHDFKGKVDTQSLQKKLDVSAANMTGRIDVLERDGLVRRKQGADRRTYIIHLTPKGKKVAAEVEIAYTKALKEIYGDFTEEELQHNIAFLTRIIEKLGMELSCHKC